MKNLKGYTAKNIEAAGADDDVIRADVEEQIKRAYALYGAMDSRQLLGALREQVRKEKLAGTFSADNMRRQIDLLRPYLSADKLAELDKILEI